MSMKPIYAFLLIFALVLNTLELEGASGFAAVGSTSDVEFQVAHDHSVEHSDLDSHQTESHKDDHSDSCHRCHLGHCLYGVISNQGYTLPTPVGTAEFVVSSNVDDVFLPNLKRPPIA